MKTQKTTATQSTDTNETPAPKTAEERTPVIVDDTNYVNIRRLEDLNDKFVSVKAAAEMLGLSLSSVSHHVRQGHIAAVTVGTSTILLRWSVEEFQKARGANKELEAEERALRLQLKQLKEKRTGKK